MTRTDLSPLEDEETLRDALRAVTSGGWLSWQESQRVVDGLMRMDLVDPRIAGLAAGWLCAVRTRGESVDEILGAARCLQERQVAVPLVAPGESLLDTCGTGGDGAHLINISTLAALVVSSLGVKVAKHGNRSISSACGSADLLEELGYPLHSSPEQVARSVEATGFGFLFAPHFHPALRNLAGLRRSLGVRTLFNLLGPLVNPAAVTHQVIGVYDRDLVEPLASVASKLGVRKALVVHGEGGLDELSPNGTTWVSLSEQGHEAVRSWEWTPAVFGAPRVSLKALRGGDARVNGQITRELLAGGHPEVAAAVAMNSAAALWLAESDSDLESAYGRAYEALRTGQVGEFFQRCLDHSQTSAD